MAFLARHGEGHRYTPTEVNYRANLWALKSLGVERLLLDVSAVGSLQARHRPGELRLVSQFIDKTRHRKDSFFGEGLVAHMTFAKPTCAHLSEALLVAGRGPCRFHSRVARSMCAWRAPPSRPVPRARLHQS